MPGTSAELQRLAIDFVAQNQPCTANRLVKALRETGANHRAANETLFALMQGGHVRRTWTGKLVMP